MILHNWEDQKSWDEFYQTYWRLIYSVALKAGLRSEEAFDAVQETILCIAKQQKEGKYDPAQGSFKAWLTMKRNRMLCIQPPIHIDWMDLARILYFAAFYWTKSATHEHWPVA